MESILPTSDRPGSSDSGGFTTRRTRSSSITSPSSLTSPTTPNQDTNHRRLGTGFSILKLEMPRSQAPQASFPKILALPPWLQDTVTELDASHPLRAVFPVLHDASDPGGVKHSLESPLDYRTPRPAHPNDANRPSRFPSTPPRIPSRACQPDSDTSSEEPQPFPTHYPMYHNYPLLHPRSGSLTPCVDVLPQPGACPTAANSYPSPSAQTNLAETAHISGLETIPLSASSLNHDSPDTVSPAPRRGVEYDGVFRYNPSQTDSPTTAPPPSQPFVFERPIRVYFDSPIEDPISSDPLEPNDYDPFKLSDPEEYKNLSFKWTPFDLQTRTRKEPTAGELETNTRSPGTDEVIVPGGSSYDLAHPLAAVRSTCIVASCAPNLGTRYCPSILSGPRYICTQFRQKYQLPHS